MTGYGRAVHSQGDIEVTVEIRAVNNRFLDIVLKVPRSLGKYEGKLRERIGKELKRGRINVWVGITQEGNGEQKLKLNNSLLRSYLDISKKLKSDFEIKGELDINHLIGLPDLFELDEDEEAGEVIWSVVEVAVDNALKSLVEMRIQEGHELLKDFRTRIDILERHINKIEELAADRPAQQMERLKERVSRIVNGTPVDEGRLEMEIALLADRLDVTEECVRFHSHNKLFLDMLDADESQGRKLNFLLQEMNREANTIGAKASSAEVSHLIVQIKEEVERIREQIQNIE